MTVARNDPLITGYRLDHAAGQTTVALTISRGTETASGTIKLGDGPADRVETIAAGLIGRSAFRQGGLPDNGDADVRIALGMLETARLDGLARLLHVPVHRLLGGALRSAVAVAVPGTRAVPPTCVVISAATSMAGVTEAVEAVAQGSSGVALQLNEQFGAEALDALQESGHRSGLAYIADPSADLASACRGFSGGRVPLALSAHRYEMPELVAAMTTGGVQVLLIDPVVIGGPNLVRALAILAELCGIEVAIDATGHDERGAVTAGGIAATLEPCTRPLFVDADVAARIAPNGRLSMNNPPASHAPCIARITLRHVSVPMRQLYVSAMYMRRTTERLIIEIETADGLCGYGETNGTADVAAACAEMARKLAGRCPLDHLPLRRACLGAMTASRNGLRDWAAWAGLEMALLDWRGRHFGVPVRQMLGDAGAESCEAVCHIPALLLDEPVDRRDLSRLFADSGRRRAVVEHTSHQQESAGFTAFKIKSTGTCPDWDVALLRDLRAALGPSVKLRWDPNANYPPAEAIAVAQRLEELNLEHYEDPTRGITGMAQVRAHVTTPLATNMCVITFDHLAHAIRQPCIDVLLADVVMWGGPQSIVDLAAVTPLLSLDLTIHSAFEVGIGTAVNLHLAAALEPIRRPVDFGLENMTLELITPRIPVCGGRVRAPEGPGLGVTPDWDEVARCLTETVTIEA